MALKSIWSQFGIKFHGDLAQQRLVDSIKLKIKLFKNKIDD